MTFTQAEQTLGVELLACLGVVLGPGDSANVTADTAMDILYGRGWHVSRVDGYDPAQGGVPRYKVHAVSADGTTEQTGEGGTLREAFLRAALEVLAA